MEHAQSSKRVALVVEDARHRASIVTLLERSLANLNLERSEVCASVNGIVTNVDLHPRTYLTPGKGVMALLDSDTIHGEGLRSFCVRRVATTCSPLARNSAVQLAPITPVPKRRCGEWIWRWSCHFSTV
jgi:hypothetical protein